MFATGCQRGETNFFDHDQNNQWWRVQYRQPTAEKGKSGPGRNAIAPPVAGV
jgi:hypothetical protein